MIGTKCLTHVKKAGPGPPGVRTGKRVTKSRETETCQRSGEAREAGVGWGGEQVEAGLEEDTHPQSTCELRSD